MHKHVFDAQKINPFEGVHHAGARPVGGSKDKAVRRREIEAAEDKIHIRSLQHRIARLDEDIRLEKVPVCMRLFIHRLYPLRERLTIELTRRRTRIPVALSRTRSRKSRWYTRSWR